MKPQKRKPVKFKTPKRYRLSFYNDNTLNLVWSVRMGIKRVIFIVAIAVIALMCMGGLILRYTPLKAILPNAIIGEEIHDISGMNERIDAARGVALRNDAYVRNLNAVLRGDVTVDSLRYSNIMVINTDSISLEPTDVEADFVNSYRLREGFSIGDASTVSPQAPVFVVPVRDLKEIVDDNVVTFDFPEGSTDVFAIARGTVADMYHAADGTYVMLIQHPDGYLSRYSGLSQAYFNRGQQVTSGALIGQYIRSQGDDVEVTEEDDAVAEHEPGFAFEILRDGHRLAPERYIVF